MTKTTSERNCLIRSLQIVLKDESMTVTVGSMVIGRQAGMAGAITKSLHAHQQVGGKERDWGWA